MYTCTIFILDWPVTHPKAKEEPQPRGNTIPGPHEDSTSQPIPKGGPHRPTAQAKAAISSYQSPRLTLPQPSGDGRSIDSTRHTLFYGHSRDCAHTLRRTTPAYPTGEADRPHYTGLSPGAIAPPAHSPVACLGVLLLPSDGSEDALPPPLRLAERMWDLIPFLDSPVVPLGEPLSPAGGSESALPSIRMVERRLVDEIPTSLVRLSKDTWGNRRLASRPCPRVTDLPSPSPSPTNQPKAGVPIHN